MGNFMIFLSDAIKSGIGRYIFSTRVRKCVRATIFGRRKFVYFETTTT